VDITYIDNFIDASLLALEALDKNPICSGKAFFITNGEPILIWDFINSILESAGMKMVQKTIPRNLALIIAWVLEKIHNVFQLKSEPYITQFVIRELSTHHWFNVAAAKTILGYSPKIKFEEGINRLKFIKEE
jgi:nucleoside-diphosphate-sugar epimerase